MGIFSVVIGVECHCYLPSARKMYRELIDEYEGNSIETAMFAMGVLKGCLDDAQESISENNPETLIGAGVLVLSLNSVEEASQIVIELLTNLMGGTMDCEWNNEEDEHVWRSSCGYSLSLPDASPMDIGFGYCPSCGKELSEVVYEDDDAIDVEVIDQS